jgi:hypothetical protein
VLGAIGLAAVACLVNPNGIEGATYPLGYIFGGHTWHQEVITEYESPDFSEPIFTILGYLIVAAMAIFAASGRRGSLWDVALTAIFLYTALRWQRNAALFAFAVGPVLALHVSDLIKRLRVFASTEGAREEGPPVVLNWAIALVLLLAAAASLPSASQRAEQKFREDMPVECVQYVKKTGLEGRMFNTYRWGGYLIWHLWPEQKVMVDGRADVMGRELVSDWRKASKLNDGWEQVLEDYEIDWALISVSAPLVRGLEEHPQWRVVCEEDTARLFVREGSVADETAGPAEGKID